MIVEGSEGVTHKDLQAYRHVSDRLPISAWLVATVELAERWSYYGTTNGFTNYIRAELPPQSRDGRVVVDRQDGVAGALGLGQQKAFAIKTFNTFFVYVTPILGAIIADTMWGRHKTILVFSVVCLVGHVILTASAVPSSLENTNGALALLVISIVIMANVSPLIAEQYTGKLRKEMLPSGETVIKSPALTYQRIYLWFYAAINVGAVGAISASFIARNHGYWTAYLVPTAIFAIVPGLLAATRKYYVITPPRGSILLETFRVLRMCLSPVWSPNPRKTWRAIKSTGFWEVAKPSTYEEGEVPASITWDDEFVGEVDRTVNACGVFLFFPFYWLCYSQIDNNLTTVSASLRLDGTPNDLVQNLNPITLIVFIPIFDRGIYPLLRKWKINFTPIKRITTGFFIAGLGMLYAAVLQHFIYQRSPCHNNLPTQCRKEDETPDPVPMSVWVIAGPYVIMGISEIFASITSLEYAFTKAPKRMRSVVMAFAQFQQALAAALNFSLTAVNVEDRFTWLFGSMGVTTWVVGALFWILNRELDKRELALNSIGTGNREGFAGETAETTVGTHRVGEEKQEPSG
ncbi:peptide/h+ symporter protein [Pterulicium gracile]|uniref:Peptide/h+ symporter protein n=1 Tax=Pterulicium gracile TaxID=1884261 RepID=A0A5C3QPI0_9AGAR|nr:peptide/h+ symporter protein [Pterula gracilis]